MSVRAITGALHEYMYEQLIDSPETEMRKNSDISIKERQKVLKN